MLSFPSHVNASENNSKKKAAISYETVITEQNIYEVFEYLGLDTNSFIADNSVNFGELTVGELESAILSINSEPKNIVKSEIVLPKIKELSGISLMSATNSMTLDSSLTVGSATITFHAVGSYITTTWTGATAGNADVDSDMLIYVFKLSNQVNRTSCTSSVITLSYSGNLDTYLGIADLGLVKIGTQTYSGTSYFYARNYLYNF